MRFILASCLCLSLLGCSSIGDMGAGQDGQRIYGGTRHNVWLLQEGPENTHAGGFALIWGVVDFPWSFALDTGLLPITLIIALFRTGSD